jgi:hypothetical protein
LLHLSSATGSASPTPTEIFIQSTTNAGDWSTTLPWARLNFYSSDTSTSGGKTEAAVDLVKDGPSGGLSNISIKTHDGTSLNEAVRVKFDGKVGIGTTAPNSILNVAKNSSDTAHTATNYPATESGILVDNLEGTTGTYAAVTMRASNGSTTQAGSILAKSVAAGFSPEIHFSQRTGSGVNQSRMIIDSSGRLLVGTSSARANFFNSSATPSTLQVEATSSTSGFGFISTVYNSNDANATAIIIGKTRGTAIGGNTVVNSGDNIGSLSFQASDGTELVPAATISAAVDGTPGANDMPGRLVFSTTADGASSPTERLRIAQDGQLTYNFTSSNAFRLVNASAGGKTGAIQIYNSGVFNSFTSLSFNVNSNGDVTNTNNSYGAISDIKLKENIVDANSQWNDLKALQVRNYNFKEGQTHTQIGLIAQEVELVSPGLVSESPDRDEDGNDLGTVTKSVNYSVLYMKAVKALQEAMERIEVLEAKVNALEGN